jgi:hypothetical protein
LPKERLKLDRDTCENIRKVSLDRFYAGDWNRVMINGFYYQSIEDKKFKKMISENFNAATNEIEDLSRLKSNSDFEEIIGYYYRKQNKFIISPIRYYGIVDQETSELLDSFVKSSDDYFEGKIAFMPILEIEYENLSNN